MADPPHTGSMAAHFTCATMTLVVLLIGLNMLLKRYDFRYDATQGRSARSRPIRSSSARIAAKQKRPIIVDAYISAFVPEEYVKTRYSLVSMLKELERQSRRQRDRSACTTTWSSSARRRPRPSSGSAFSSRRSQSQARGALKEEEFIMGVAFTCGLEKVVLPSFKLGMPVEYELVRSIATVGRRAAEEAGRREDRRRR